MGRPHRIGIVGVGNISRAYLETFAEVSDVEITAIADLDLERASTVAASLPSARSMTVDQLVESDGVDAILNLTLPASHSDIALRALAAGKHTYGEKPLALDVATGREMVQSAASAGLRLGCAPDTVLGTGTQTARAAIEGGLIGRPLAATATMMTPGHERWHPAPDFYYLPGGGPLLDMGPYYVSSLIHLLGPVVSVVGAGSRLRSERVIGGGPREGETIPVEVDTHLSGILQHANGALSTLTTSFDAVATAASPIEVHGELASLTVPDPNTFGGDVRLYRLGGEEWQTLPASAGFEQASRGIGLLDLLRAGEGTAPRAGGELALHALEVMLALIESAHSGSRVTLATTVEVPALVPLTPRSEWTSGATPSSTT